ncbi:PAS domain S-box-containing protein [Alkalibaculum bacchi]|uniref:histidine kinase n=1 Tax=Alkalibaculum bacchi TaxID=645887 RepID=A0A366I8X7_9FIRM|nr:ATP-binding protein [Alkalibaculum bacchi]RBP65910.1 PAS domain S-box-containing protein [Alkalibaculum bacchi]
MACNNKRVLIPTVLDGQLINHFFILYFNFFIASLALSTFIWPNSSATLHIGFEIIYAMITICIFSVIWVAIDFEDLSPMYRVIGFGLLTVTVLSLFHIAEFINVYKDRTLSLFEMHTPYWLTARIVEAIIIVHSAMVHGTNKKHTKIFLLIKTVSIIMAIILFIHFARSYLRPYAKWVYQGEISLILFSTMLVYIIILGQIIRGSKYDFTKDRHVIRAIFCFIGAAICPLLLNINVQLKFLIILGYLFKLGAYFALLQGVYLQAIILPYKALGRSKEQLNKTLNSLPLGVMEFKPNKGITYANQYLLDLLECTPSDLYQMTISEFYTAFEAELQSEQYEVFELKTLKGHHIITQLKKFENENSTLIALTDTRAEQKLNTLHLQTEMIFNSIASMIILFDENHTIIYANKSNEQCVELDANSIIGLSVYEYNKMLDLKRNNEDYLKYDGIRHQNARYTLITPSGKKKTIISQYKEIKDAYDNIVGYVSIASDITDMIREQEKIQQQERLALIGQMGNGIVHETKNYLASIKGYCDLLTLNSEDMTIKNYASKIETIANDMNALVSKYLELSRPSEAILDILSINELIESVLYIIKSPSFLDNTLLKLDLCKGDMEILADDNLIKHVIINLAKNGVEAMTNVENALLIISTKVKGHFMEISVKDNGCGISKENIKKLGTPFFTTKQCGTGLGLANCFKIISESGGQINVDSKLGEGTTFYIELPIFEDDVYNGKDPKKNFSTIA